MMDTNTNDSERIVVSSVLPGDGGKPLADWLAERFLYCDRAAWSDYIGSDCIAVNGRSAEADAILQAGDRVSFAPRTLLEPDMDPSFTIAYEDGDFIIIDKPANLPCHPGGRYFANTLWHMLLAKGDRIHIATRLDRETSGLLLVCKTRQASRHARELQSRGQIDKRYLVAVHGDFPERLEARGVLVKDDASPIRKKRRFLPEGNPAGGESCETGFVLLARAGGFSLVEAKLVTGRNHQIRATLYSLGFPVVGDKIYGLDDGFFIRFIDGSLTEGDAARLILPNQALHSASLSFAGLEGETIARKSDPSWNFPPAALSANGTNRPSEAETQEENP